MVYGAMVDSEDGRVELEQLLCKMRFVPTRVEFHYDSNKFDMVGISPLFDELQPGEALPEYVVESSKGNDGLIVSVHVNKI